MDKIATFVKTVKTFGGDKSLYKVTPPVPWEWGILDMETGTRTVNKETTSFVLISYIPDECGIFPCTENGNVVSMIDIASRKGGNITALFRQIGYEIEVQ
jgi:hypothetical protein